MSTFLCKNGVRKEYFLTPTFIIEPLDSGTLTPVLKTLERQGYVARTRSKLDERVVVVLLTEKGAHLKEKALSVPEQMSCHLMQRGLSMTLEEAEALKKKLYEILACLSS